MKKIITFLGIIVTILIIALFFMPKLSKDTVNVSYFKQAPIKYSGTVYGRINKELQLSFDFLDKNNLSEMNNKNNIKEMFVIDNKEKMIPIKSWQINNSSFDNYSIRNIDAKVIFNKKDNFILNKILIKYVDSVSEKFDIGSLKVVINENTHGNTHVYNSSQDLINSSDKTYSNFSGILVTLGKVDVDNIKLVKIDLGIDKLGIDKKNIKAINKRIANINMTDLEKEFNSPKLVEKVTTQIDPVNINFNKNDFVTLLIPITVEKNKTKENNTLIFNPKLTFNINGKEYEQVGDSNLISKPL